MSNFISRLSAFVLSCVFVCADDLAATTNGLVVFYPFSGSASDAGPRKNDGTAHGTVLSSDRFGRAISAAHFTGAGAYLESKQPLPDSDSITIGLWLSLDSWTQLGNWGAPQVVFFEGDDGGGHDVACYIMGGIHFAVKSNESISYSSWLPPLHSWIHLVCVADSARKTMAIWVDGKKVEQGIFSKGANVGYHAPFNLGRRPGGYNDWFLAGSLDEVRVYNRALSDSEIGTLYIAESGKARSLEVAIETVRVTMRVIPGKSYLLQWSNDMRTWTNQGSSFVAESVEYQASVNTVDHGMFWRLVEVP